MVHILDGAGFTYPYGGRPEPDTRATGWLAVGEFFPRGDPPEGFLDQLIMLCRMPVNLTRGLHACPFCPAGERAQAAGGAWVQSPGGDFVTGYGEIRVTAPNGARYAAPDMVAHYVQSHGYRPPDPFVSGVLAADLLPVDHSGDLRLGVSGGEWVLTEAGASRPVAGDLSALIPLLNRAPEPTLAAIAQLNGPEFPLNELLTVALQHADATARQRARHWLITTTPQSRPGP